jgi:Superfamily II DNA helicase
MRNIRRVVLWGLPPSFCALAQRAGRAGRDFSTLAEAILIVPASVIKSGATALDVGIAVRGAAVEAQAENRSEEEAEILEQNGIELTRGNEEVLVNDGGVRVAHGSDDEEEEAQGKKQKRKKISKEGNSHEARYLSIFASSLRCLHAIWNEFFNNNKKGGFS